MNTQQQVSFPVGTVPAGESLDMKRKLPVRPKSKDTVKKIESALKKEVVKKQESSGCGCW